MVARGRTHQISALNIKCTEFSTFWRWSWPLPQQILCRYPKRANLSEPADQVKAGAEKIITKNGESYVALIDAERLDYYHQLEREKVHLILIDEASKGVDDIGAGRTKDARGVIAALKKHRKA